jgi:hypothetical protein
MVFTNKDFGALAPADAAFLRNLYQKLYACIGQSLRNIGESEVDF